MSGRWGETNGIERIQYELIEEIGSGVLEGCGHSSEGVIL
jgi:hypothetical protein